jgi:protein-S-isoprenylcysteine O-methyltransferase Ste14
MSRIVIIFLLFISPVLAALLAWLGFLSARDNPIGGFLFLVGTVYILTMGFAIFIRKKDFWSQSNQKHLDQEEKGDLSFWLIIPGMLVAFFSSPIEYLFFSAVPSIPIWLKMTGLILTVIGLAFFIWARKVLGSYYSGHVSVQNEHRLVQSGPYHFVRHPAYLGFLLMGLGISLGYLSLLGLAVIPILLLPGLIYRINVEDKQLDRQFGDEFREYAGKTARLFPWLW